MGLTERIARACAVHPGRTFAAWGVALVASILCLLFVMTGLTTEPTLTNNPQSDKAADAIHGAFPLDPQRTVTDVVVVRSESHMVDDPEFREFVARLEREGRATGGIAGGTTYYATNDRSLVSADGHATLVPLFIDSEEAAGDVIDVVERADEDVAF